MPGLAAGVTVASGLFQGLSSMAQANTQARILQQQAVRESQIGRAQEENFRDRISRAKAANRARAGVSGVRQDVGSPLGVSQDFAGEAELQALRIRNNFQSRIGRLQQEQSLVKRAGVSGAIGGLGRAGAGFLRVPSFGGSQPDLNMQFESQGFMPRRMRPGQTSVAGSPNVPRF